MNRKREGIMAAKFRNGAAALCLTVAAIAAATFGPDPAMAAAAGQRSFASPQQAVDALVAAAREPGTRALLQVFGPGSRQLISSGDRVADESARKAFLAASGSTQRIVQEGPDRATLIVGSEEWPFPIPIVREGQAWAFDLRAGAEKILDRRIGRNELGAIEACRAYADAQREYASRDRNADGLREYAQRFLSRPGKQDGLYWPAEPREEQSPIGPLVVRANAEGYTVNGSRAERAPYHGYYYRILTRQGPNAPGGAYDYVAKGRMIGGFALVAFPARYGVSGVMTFLINHEGVVYQKDLGPGTGRIARRMRAFDPDASWTKP